MSAPPVEARPVGLGCMRLSTDAGRSDERAALTLTAAIDAGVTLLDTAASYGLDAADAHRSERVVGRVLRDLGGRARAVEVVTKGGLVREGAAWVPDGRRKSLRASCEASLDALGGRRIDLYLLHAPDPKTPLARSARALAALAAEGLVGRVGLSNVSRSELERVAGEVEISAVEVALGAFDDEPFRSGLVAYCVERGIRVLAHSPLGGPQHAPRLAKDRILAELAEKHATTPGSIVLAWLYALSDGIVPIPGARRPETALLAARAPHIVLDASDRARLDERFPAAQRALSSRREHLRGAREPSPSAERAPRREIVVLMGIQAAGKSRLVESFVREGYERLNRDERGGTMRGLHRALDERLAAGGARFVLDNTYPTRASRSELLAIAERHGASARVLFLDTPIEAAQAHAVARLYERYGKVPTPAELAALAKKDPGAFGPSVQHRYRRELEPPARDEGWSEIDIIAYERAPAHGATARGLVFAAELALAPREAPAGRELRALLAEHAGAPVLAFGFADGRLAAKLDAATRELALAASTTVRVEICGHGGGPPVCWCRPPLPGLVLPWIREERVDPGASLLLGAAPAHRAMARGLGLGFRGAAL